MLALVLLALASAAHAAVVSRDVCIQVLPAFADNDYTSNGDDRYPGDDYLIDDAVAEPLRGTWIEIQDNASGATFGTWADDGGATPGCAHLSVDTTKTYAVRVKSQAKVSGHTVYVWKPYLLGMPAKNLYTLTLTAAWAPLLGGPGPTYTINNGNQEWNVATAATWALHHRDGGLSPQTYDLFNMGCPTPGNTGQCFVGVVTFPFLYLPGSYVNSPARSNITHELGHQLLYKKLGAGVGNRDDAWYGRTFDATGNLLAPGCARVGGGTPPPPPPHQLQKKEFGTEAFWESFANFYAAVSLNRNTDSDCIFQYYKVQDFDLDGDLEPLTVNCRGIPWNDASGVPFNSGDLNGYSALVGDHDYLYDSNVDLSCDPYGNPNMDPAGNPPEGPGAMVNRATELDYLRFFWDMYHDQSMPLATILDIVALSNPTNWTNLDDPALATQRPSQELLTGATAYDAVHGTAWAGIWHTEGANHGVAR